MKTHEWKAMGRVIYGSRKTALKGKFCGRIELYDATNPSAHYILVNGNPFEEIS
jgi:hypothetical protein